MQPTTLRGIFPERKAVPRKNFIKENVRRLRQMQIDVSRQGSSETRVAVPRLTKIGTSSGPKLDEVELPALGYSSVRRQPGIQKLEISPINRGAKVTTRGLQEKDERLTHRGVQTEADDNIDAIYSTGTVRFPSPAVVSALVKAKKKDQGHGDSPPLNLHDRTNKIDYIKRNMMVKAKSPEKDNKHNPNVPPANYKRGTVPKYIKQKREVSEEDSGDVECPEGHVLLPDEERRETLRVLRESYAEKIQELNSMPVRSDTLRMQRRKIELEEELKKIDEGVKVFQRPKVFVKINV